MVDYRESPRIAFPWTIRLGIIELIDPPVITLAEFEKDGGSISSIFLVLADQYILWIGSAGFGDIVGNCSEVHIMLVSIGPRPPAKSRILWHIYGAVTRTGAPGLRQRPGRTQRVVNRHFKQCISVLIP